MNFVTFGTKKSTAFKVAILIKDRDLVKSSLEKHYVNPLVKAGIKPEDIIAIGLDHFDVKVPSVTKVKAFLTNLSPQLRELGIKYLFVCDAIYFKAIANVKKTSPNYGYILKGEFTGYKLMLCTPCANYSVLFNKPTFQDLINRCLDTLIRGLNDQYVKPGDIIKHGKYPTGLIDIKKSLNRLHMHDAISCDIETRSLMIDKAGIETISFAWEEHSGLSFAVDKSNSTEHRLAVRGLLKEFFETYKGTLIGHGFSYDIKILIYELWMDNIDDIKGLLKGLNILTNNMHDTMIIYYLATNTTAGNFLGLKEISQEFAGDYAEANIKDTSLISNKELLVYNLKDTLATLWVFNKYYPRMVKEEQESIYREQFLPNLKVLIQTELTGMPLDMDKVLEAEEVLKGIVNKNADILRSNRYIRNFTFFLVHFHRKAANAKLKVKVHPYTYFISVVFNPGSSKHIAMLLHDFLKYPILDKTPTGLAATGNKNLLRLRTLVDDTTKEIINAICELNIANKILTTFIPAFKDKSILHADGLKYLHGSLNICGTISHRLSSSKPNLQNLPSNSVYGKLIKSCFISPPNYIHIGADYSSLESKISALLTKDTNKVSVYTDGYDSHCLAAYFYFQEQMPDIVKELQGYFDGENKKISKKEAVNVINSIKHKYPKLRQSGKMPSFLCTYEGTWLGIVQQGDFTEKQAKHIEASYHKLYAEADAWVREKIKEACRVGYVTLAFGGRLRTPILAQMVYNSNMHHKAKEESRSAGNALGQSYGLLNSRSTTAFMQKVWDSKYRYDIRPIAQIHDAAYFLIPNKIECLKFVNDRLIEEMLWQDLEAIKHPDVPLGGELDCFYEGWHQPITLSNNATIKELKVAIKEGIKYYNDKKKDK